MDISIKIPKDTLVLLSSGEYSDYSLEGLYITTSDLYPEKIRNDYINEYPEQTDTYMFKESTFKEYLLKNNYVKPMGCTEWYMGSYSSIKNMEVYTKGISGNFI
jgi:hypothetical protein